MGTTIVVVVAWFSGSVGKQANRCGCGCGSKYLR